MSQPLVLPAFLSQTDLSCPAVVQSVSGNPHGMQAFVTSRVDYCNAVPAESPRVITDKLQRVMNSAARVVIATLKSSIALCRDYCMMSSTGSMSPIEYDSSSHCSCIDASWNCSAVLDGQLYANSRRHWSSTSAVCQSAQVDRTVLPTERCRSSAFCCCGPSTWNSLYLTAFVTQS